MGRTCSWFGIPDVAMDIISVQKLTPKEYMKEEFYMQDYPLHEYYLGGVLKYREEVQCELWDGGPNVFLKLVSTDGEGEILWKPEAIEDIMGFDGI